MLAFFIAVVAALLFFVLGKILLPEETIIVTGGALVLGFITRTIFDKMLSLAQDLELPVNLHTKGAEKIVFDILLSYGIPNINIHWYSGPEELLKLGIDRGYYFSITPAINYSSIVKKVATTVDKEHLLLESDGPVKYYGEVGVPASVKNVLHSISKLREKAFFSHS